MLNRCGVILCLKKPTGRPALRHTREYVYSVYTPWTTDEPRSYSHNAVGLAAADRTQRPVDAAGAEDEDAYPRGVSAQ
jgi:hypothetical protein